MDSNPNLNPKPNPDPVWKRPGHFDRFEFLNNCADPQILDKVHFEFKKADGSVVCTMDHTSPSITLPHGGMWGWTTPPTEGYGDAVKFTGTVDLASGKHVNFDFDLVGKPDHTYIWVLRVGIGDGSPGQLVAFGDVEYMEPQQVQLQPGEWTIT